MFDSVIVGIDGGARSGDAIAIARQLAAPGAQLALVHVRPHTLAGLGEDAEESQEGARDSQEMLERERDAAAIEAELVSAVSTRPGRGLHDQAELRGADLIVVGSTAAGAFRRAMLSEDSRAALNGAPCAVAIASRAYAERGAPLASVGVGYDGSPESGTALAAARELAARHGASLLAMWVVSLATYGWGPYALAAIEDVDSLMAEARERLEQLGGVEPRPAFGLVGEELAAFGDELDLLVVGSRNYGPLRRLVVGSTAHYLQRHARCSLLVLPRGGG